MTVVRPDLARSGMGSDNSGRALARRAFDRAGTRLRTSSISLALNVLRAVPQSTAVLTAASATGRLIATVLTSRIQPIWTTAEGILVLAGKPAIAHAWTAGVAKAAPPSALAAMHRSLVVAAQEDQAKTIEARAPADLARVLTARRRRHQFRVEASLLGAASTSREFEGAGLELLGAHHEALDLTRVSADSPGEANVHFDAAWQLGIDVGPDLERILAAGTRDLGLFQRAVRSRRLRGDDIDELCDLAIAGRFATPADRDWATELWFTAGRLDRIIDLASLGHRLGPVCTFNAARAHYIQREFSEARRLARSLAGTWKHWDADKLVSRIDLELGEVLVALKNREQTSRLSVAFDEVEYFALLHLRRFDEAFEMYLDWTDRSRAAAWLGVPPARRLSDLSNSPVRTLALITQNGPGDELLQTMSLGTLASATERLVVTCDPRLHPLLARSFPTVEWLPTPRSGAAAPFGFALQSQRPRNVLHDLLDARASSIVSAADRVALGRSWPVFAHQHAPHRPTLRPDSARLSKFKLRLGTRRIGFVWRSEVVDPMRQIHYCSASDLAPLKRIPTDFVCLQHDLTAAERETIVGLFGERVLFLDDVDLRDDFESIAAVLAACVAVVGVGTTTVELAASVGTYTVCLQPNWIGSWRAVLSDGNHGAAQPVDDFWHSNMSMAVTRNPRTPSDCVELAANDLIARLALTQPWATKLD